MARSITVSSDDTKAISLAGGLIRHPEVVGTFMRFLRRSPGAPEPHPAFGNKHLPNLTPQQWAAKFGTALRVEKFLTKATATIETGFIALWAAKKDSIKDLAKDLPAEQQAIFAELYWEIKTELVADKADPRWLALLIFCYGRMLAATNVSGFEADTWSEDTMALFRLEHLLTAGEGKAFAREAVTADSRFFGGKMSAHIGKLMPHGLAELIRNCADSEFVDYEPERAAPM